MTVKERWYRCYRCGSSGTVIDLQMALTGSDFTTAVNTLDAMFALGLAPTKPSELLAAKRQLAQRQLDKMRRTARAANNDTQYTLLCFLRRYCVAKAIDCARLDEILDYYLPYDDNDALPDAFVLAADAGLGEQMEVMILAVYDTAVFDTT